MGSMSPGFAGSLNHPANFSLTGLPLTDAILQGINQNAAGNGEGAGYGRDLDELFWWRQLEPVVFLAVGLAHVVMDDRFGHEDAKGDAGDEKTAHDDFPVGCVRIDNNRPDLFGKAV